MLQRVRAIFVKRTGRILATIALAVSVTVGAASAESDKCIRELPIKRTEHWSYRIVNGQRCWFPNRERSTVAINAKRKLQAPKSAQRSSNPKVGLARPPSAAENELQTSDAFVKVWNDRVTSSSRIGLLRSPSGVVENESQAFAAVTKVLNDPVTPRDAFGRVLVATSRFEHPAPTEAGLPLSLVAHQRSAALPIAATTTFDWAMWWFGLGVGALAVSMFGRTGWKKMRSIVVIVGQILKARLKVRQRSHHVELKDDPRQLMNPPLDAINFSRMN